MKACAATAAVVLVLTMAASSATAATFDVLETSQRNDDTTGRFALPAGVSEAGAAALVPAFNSNTATDLNEEANSDDAFGTGDVIRVFAAMGAGSDDLLFEIESAFTVTLSFLSDASPSNQPAFRLFAGMDPGTGGDALFDETPAGAVARNSPLDLGAGQSFAAGTYVLRTDGTNGAAGPGNVEAYDIFITAQTTPIPLPAGGLLLTGGLCGLAALRRRG